MKSEDYEALKKKVEAAMPGAKDWAKAKSPEGDEKNLSPDTSILAGPKTTKELDALHADLVESAADDDEENQKKAP